VVLVEKRSHPICEGIRTQELPWAKFIPDLDSSALPDELAVGLLRARYIAAELRENPLDCEEASGF